MADTQKSGSVGFEEGYHRFLTREALPGLGLDMATVMSAIADLTLTYTMENRNCLLTREAEQEFWNSYHKSQRILGKTPDGEDMLAAAKAVGFITDPPKKDFQVEAGAVDHELASMASSQLVVPQDNLQLLLNALNARFVSLLGALYATDVIPKVGELAPSFDSHNPVRGTAVFGFCHSKLDLWTPIKDGKWEEVVGFKVVKKADRFQLRLEVNQSVSGDDSKAKVVKRSLEDGSQFVGFTGKAKNPLSLILTRHGLKIQIVLDPEHNPDIDYHPAGIRDVILESTGTTIKDCEDAAAAATAVEQVSMYRNGLNVTLGNASVLVERSGGKRFTRRLNPDTPYTGSDGQPAVLKGRTLGLTRSSGSHIDCSLVTINGSETPQFIQDQVVAVINGAHDILGNGVYRNSEARKIVIVLPKTCNLAEAIMMESLHRRLEKLFGLTPYTIQVGVMDEEEFTTQNLRAIMYVFRKSLVFINTGFLDRTGSKIAQAIRMGIFAPKAVQQKSEWMREYERANCWAGLYHGCSQIGKGMWAMPDEMLQMLEVKGAQLEGGANTAWVPSPSASVLHATHYLDRDVVATQGRIFKKLNHSPPKLEEIMMPVLVNSDELTAEEIATEVKTNLQSILGYVARWMQGVGCSKIPNLLDIGLMEDQATIRISVMIIRNWLYWGVVNIEFVEAMLQEVAALIAVQQGDESLSPAGNNDHVALECTRDLVDLSRPLPQGMTTPTLIKWRRKAVEDDLTVVARAIKD